MSIFWMIGSSEKRASAAAAERAARQRKQQAEDDNMKSSMVSMENFRAKAIKARCQKIDREKREENLANRLRKHHDALRLREMRCRMKRRVRK